MMMAMSTGSRFLWVTTCVTCCIAAPPSRAAESIIRAALSFRSFAAAPAVARGAPAVLFFHLARGGGLEYHGGLCGAPAPTKPLETTPPPRAPLHLHQQGP